MRNACIFCFMVAVLAFSLAESVLAQDKEVKMRAQPTGVPENIDLQTLQRIIEEQQKQLDAQQAQLELQNQRIQELRRQAQKLAKTAAHPNTHATEASQAKPLKGVAPKIGDAYAAETGKSKSPDDWQGSFAVEGLNTRFKIGGFIELDVIHDTDAIASKGQFVTSTITTRKPAKAAGSDGQTNFSVNPTRLFLETRTPVAQHRLTTFLAVDFFGDALNVRPDPRMRQAYGELSGILFGGDLLVGQAWSTFANLDAYPNVLDFQGPNSFLGTRQPLVRWRKRLGGAIDLRVAAETPDNHIIQGADALTAWPDGVLSVAWDQPALQLMGSFMARDLRASLSNGPAEAAFGWGGSVSGKLGLPFWAKKDFLTFSVTYGEGIGSNLNDQPPDAAFDGTRLHPIPVFGWFVSYQHGWSEQFNSTLVYGRLDVDHLDAQPPDALDNTQYASANLVWEPTKRWLLGVEGLWGKRADKDGASGTDFRTQFTSRLTF